MELIANIFLISGSFGAAAYCYALHRKLTRLNQLNGGIGGAIAVLSLQVDELTRALEQAKNASSASSTKLAELTRKADATASRLELTLATLHDLPAAPEEEPPALRRARYTRLRRTSSEAAA